VIPSEIAGVVVTSIGMYSFYYTGLTSVTLPETITEIQDMAFYGNLLESIVIPAGVETIENNAFGDNPITSITIMGEELRFNDDWEMIGFPLTLASYIFVTADGLVFNLDTGEIVAYSGVLTELIIPSEIDGVIVTSIGDYVFYENQTITLVAIPDTVTHIGDKAFASTDGTLVTLVLGNGVEEIGYQAFRGHGLASIVIPESVTTIGDSAFMPTTSIPNPITSITIGGDESRFYDRWLHIGFPIDLAPFMFTTTEGIVFNTHTHEITDYIGIDLIVLIPSEIDGSEVNRIGDYAFNSAGLTSVVIPESITSIGNYAFGHNTLTSITIPESVETIENNAFYGNPLTLISIHGDSERFDEDWEYIGFPLEVAPFIVVTPDGLLFDITTGEIKGYNGILIDLVIPSEIDGVPVTSIRGATFYNKGLTSVTLPDSIITIGADAFGYNALTSIIIPANVESIGSYAFMNNPFTNVTIFGDASRFNEHWEHIGFPILLAPFVLTTSSGIVFNSYSGAIIDYTGTLTDVIIPSEILGFSVVSIGSYAFDSNGLTSVIIPESVNTIGHNAFRGNSFTSVIIYGDENRFNSNWTYYGFPLEMAPYIALSENGLLLNKDTGEIVQYIGTSLDVVIPAEIEGFAVTRIEYGGGLTDLVIPSEIAGVVVTSIGMYSFYYTGLTSVTLPETITEIQDMAFYGNLLESIVIPAGVETIENNAFGDNPITSITIMGEELRFNDDWEMIGFPLTLASYIFVTADGLVFNLDTGEIVAYSGVLTELIIPSEIDGVIVTSIGDYVFYENQTITLVAIPDTVTHIGDKAFASTDGTLVTLVLGNGVEEIGYQAFRGHGLASIVIPESVTTIGDSAFMPTTSIPNPITSITIGGDESRFYDRWLHIGFPIDLAPFMFTTTEGIVFNTHTHEITDYIGIDLIVLIPSEIDGSEVNRIGDYAFNSAGLTSVVIPESITSIGNYAFGHNTLTSITIPESVETIENNAFYGNPLTLISIHGDSERFDEDWEYIGFPLEVAPFIVVTPDGLLFDITTGEIKGYNGILIDLVIPSEIDGVPVTSIRGATFYNKGLTSVTLPDSIITIGADAFGYNALTSIIIPANVESIGSYAFMNNPFTNVTIFGDASRFNEHWEHIGFPILLAPFVLTTSSGIVFNSYSGAIIDYTGTLTDVIIPSEILGFSVVSIGSYAFDSNGLTSVIIPESVNTIGHNAFRGNSFTSVIIYGDENRFNSNWTYYGFPLEMAPYIALSENGLLLNKDTGEIVQYIGTSLDVVIPAEIEGFAVTRIEYGVFENRGLTSVSLPEGLLTIEGWAFAYSNISEITIPASVTEIQGYAFYYNNLTSVTILGDEDRFADNWEYIGFPILLAPFVVTTPEGFVFNTYSGEIIQYTGTQTDLVIPSEIEGVSVVSIDDYAFYSAGLTSVVLPNTLTYIGYSSFGYNPFTSIIIPESVTNIYDYAFYSAGLTSVVLPNTLTHIGYCSFQYNSLTSIIIPESVTNIGDYAFQGNPLSTVTILGDETRFDSDWMEIGFPFDPERINAVTINIGDSINTTFDDYGDTDYYELVVTTTTTVTIYTESSYYTYGTLYDETGVLLASNYGGGTGSNFSITYTLSPGTYYIGVYDYNYFWFNYTLYVESS